MVGRVRFFGGGDESLIQETARPRGRLSTGFLRGWFSLYPTTRHYPFHEIDHGAPRSATPSRLRPLSGEGTTPWSLFGGCDQSLIQVTARPSGRDSTWFLQSWFSLDPTTRHYPFFEIDHDTGCGRLSLSLCSLVKDSLALETLWLQ